MFSLPPPPSLPLSFLPLSLSFMFCSFKCNLHAAKLKCKDSQGSFINLDKSMHPRQQPRPPPSRQGTFHSQPSRKFPRLLPAQHGPAPTRATSAQLPATKLASSLPESHADAGAGAGAGSTAFRSAASAPQACTITPRWVGCRLLSPGDPQLCPGICVHLRLEVHSRRWGKRWPHPSQDSCLILSGGSEVTGSQRRGSWPCGSR